MCCTVIIWFYPHVIKWNYSIPLYKIPKVIHLHSILPGSNLHFWQLTDFPSAEQQKCPKGSKHTYFLFINSQYQPFCEFTGHFELQMEMLPSKKLLSNKQNMQLSSFGDFTQCTQLFQIHGCISVQCAGKTNGIFKCNTPEKKVKEMIFWRWK